MTENWLEFDQKCKTMIVCRPDQGIRAVVIVPSVSLTKHRVLEYEFHCNMSLKLVPAITASK